MQKRATIGGRGAAILAATAAAWSLGAAPAEAVPGLGELYVGGGLRSFGGTPGLSESGKAIDYGGTLELGIDDIAFLPQWGAGLRGDWNDGPGRWSAELRYTALSLPLVRAVVGASLGYADSGLDGRLGGFVAARVVLGLPYVGLQVGVYRDPVKQDVSSGGQLTVGVAF